MYTDFEQDLQTIIKRIDEMTEELRRNRMVDLHGSIAALSKDRGALVEAHDRSIIARYQKDANELFYEVRFGHIHE